MQSIIVLFFTHVHSRCVHSRFELAELLCIVIRIQDAQLLPAEGKWIDCFACRILYASVYYTKKNQIQPLEIGVD